MRSTNPFVASLESRCFLSANAFVDSHHVLHVHGFQQLASTITVGLDQAGTGINVSVSAPNHQGGTKSFTDDIPNASKITKVVIVGGTKNDSITIDETNHPFTIKTRIEGRGGDDTITAGSENDVILGGWGKDTINAGAGDDFVHAGHGDDQINGGDGNDSLWGGFGDDTVVGGAGNDKMGGVLGKNNLEGDAGADTFFVRALAKNVNDFTQGEDILKIITRSNSDGTDPTPVTDQGV